MPKYEYLVEYVPLDFEYDDDTARLINDHARQGWRLVAVAVIDTYRRPKECLYFERPVEETSE